MRKLVTGSLVLLAFGTFSTPLWAQQSATPTKDEGTSTAAERREERREERRAAAKQADENRPDGQTANANRGNADEQLAGVLFTGCNNEVQIAKFALPMLNSNEAKQFAERLVKDHQAQCEKLEKLAGNYHHSSGITLAEPKAKLEFGRLKLEASGSTLKANGEGGTPHSVVMLDWVHIQQQIANECLASTKAELQRHDGKHFDECFIGMQIAGHMKMVDQLKVFQQYASSNLRGQIDAGLETAQSHLKEAKAIMESQARTADKSTTSK